MAKFIRCCLAAAMAVGGVTGAYAAAPTAAWVYGDKRDAMMDTIVKSACVKSQAVEPVRIPLREVRADLCIATDGRNSVIYFRTPGSEKIRCFEPGVSWCPIWVRFDSDKAAQWVAKYPPNGARDSLSLGPFPDLLKVMKQRNRMMVRIPAFGADDQDFIFPIFGLRWP